MKAPERPTNEAQRLDALRGYQVLDTEKELAFERLTSLAANLLDVPIALVSLVDEARQWFKSVKGLDATEGPRDLSFCGHAILDAKPLIVPDALEDTRFADNPMVTGEPHVRSYAGAPLVTPRGFRIGTLCAVDRKPRTFSAVQQQVLTDLAALVIDQLELRSARLEKEREAIELAALLGAFPTAVLVVDGNTIRFANAEAGRVLGHGPETLIGRSHLDLIHPDERDASVANRRSSPPGSAPRVARRRLLRADGETITVEGTIGPLTWSGAQAVAVAFRDVTTELKARDFRDALATRLKDELGLMLTAFDVLPDGIVLFDPEFRCVYANRAMAMLLGVDGDVLKGWTPDNVARHVATLTETPDVVPAPRLLRRVTESPSEAVTLTLVRPRHRVLQRTLHRLGSPTHPWLAVWRDITLESQQLAQREEEALTDPLTRLPNRRAMEARVTAALSNDGLSTVAFLDIDHFKKVNDTYGHPAGDEVLRLVGRVLASCTRGGDLVGRWGGEEFIALLRTDLEGGRKFAERVRTAVSALQTPAGTITISCGVAQKGLNDDMVKAADVKLYEAKQQGRNRVCS